MMDGSIRSGFAEKFVYAALELGLPTANVARLCTLSRKRRRSDRRRHNLKQINAAYLSIHTSSKRTLL